MESLCIKINNNTVLEHLENFFSDISLDKFCYSRNKFKVYSNIILHYNGNDIYSFYNIVSDGLQNCICTFFEQKIINRLINYNYFYFDDYEKDIIKLNCKSFLSTSTVEEVCRKNELLWIPICNYIIENKSIVLDGFVNFRLNDYIKYLDEIVDLSVNKFIIDKEYLEFINLLQLYIQSKPSTVGTLHLIYSNDDCVILDDKKNLVEPVKHINAKYLSDISFSCNDFALNTLLTLLPSKLYIHLICEEDEFIDTLKNIFTDRIVICKDCNICRAYNLSNSTASKND